MRPVRKQISWVERTDQSGHDAADGGGDAEEVGDGGGVEELVLWAEVQVRLVGATKMQAYGDFLLGDDHCGVLSPNRNGGVSGA